MNTWKDISSFSKWLGPKPHACEIYSLAEPWKDILDIWTRVLCVAEMLLILKGNYTFKYHPCQKANDIFIGLEK